RAYLLGPAASTFIRSVSLLLDGFSFHLPTNGSFEGHNVPVPRPAHSSQEKERFGIEFLPDRIRVFPGSLDPTTSLSNIGLKTEPASRGPIDPLARHRRVRHASLKSPS